MNLPGDERLRKFRAGEAYMARGWKTFVLGWEKRPIKNCWDCQPENAGWTHDAEACTCLTCHGFYAATLDRDRLWAMLHAAPDDGLLAVRTGRASGLLVLDAESAEKSGEGQEAGVDVLDNFEHWSGGLELPATLQQRTGSGGLHLVYALPAEISMSSRRILPNVDLKADGGYVVVPPGGGRTWLNWSQVGGTVTRPAEELLTWLRGKKGLSASNTAGPTTAGILALRAAETVPAGMRYEFTQKITYMLRKQSTERGLSLGDALSICREYWNKYEQPEDDFYPFARVEYELNRVWHRVEPAEPMDARLASWLERKRQASPQGESKA